MKPNHSNRTNVKQIVFVITLLALATLGSAEEDGVGVRGIELRSPRKWAPIGADRFYELVQKEFYKDCRFFRVVPGFMVQFGINGDPAVQKSWRDAKIKDDPVVASNQRGYITYAMAGPNTRTTQLFINFGDNSFLDGQNFAPFGRVTEGMEVIDKINAEYQEKPNQGQIQTAGNEYLNGSFPNLDYIKSIKLVE